MRVSKISIVGLTAGVAMVMIGSAHADRIEFGAHENGEPSAPADRGLMPIAGEIVPGDSYFAYTNEQSTCNGDGTMTVSSSASWAQLDGDVQTTDRNDAEDGAGETIIRGPAGDTSGTGGWNSFGDWQLEADDTGFETVRGRDGGTLSDPLIFETTVRYDCSGAAAGEPPVRTYESFHRGARTELAVPTLSGISLALLTLLVAVIGSVSVLRR
jgi:hypothetical protein